VHAHGWSKALSPSVVALAIRRKFKVVCTLHDYFVACPNGGFFDYRKNAICKEIPLSAGCLRRNCDARSYPQKLWRVARQIVQEKCASIPSGINHFITVSRFSEAILRPFLPHGAKIYSVDNPVDVAQRGCVDAGSNRAFVYVGRLRKPKAYSCLLAAAKRMDVAPVFVGEGECAGRDRPQMSAGKGHWLVSQRTGGRRNGAGAALVFAVAVV